MLPFENAQLRFMLLLLFPTAEMAWSWAQTAVTRSAGLADDFAALLEALP